MNVIFLDFDGVLTTIHGFLDEDVERRIKILADICHKYDCKVVIEAASKDAIYEDTLEIYSDWVEFVFDCFKKYKIECIGRTPNVTRKLGKFTYIDMWKEDEIIQYLKEHPEVEHYCVIDDDDLLPVNNSDLNKVREHLVSPILYSKNPEEEGLLESHSSLIGEILQKENDIQLLLRRNK